MKPIWSKTTDETHGGLSEALQACRSAALRGYQIAKENLKELTKAFDIAAKSLLDSMHSMNKGTVHSSNTIKQLQEQLFSVVGELEQLLKRAEQELQRRRERLGLFSVSLFGRTMAGKSTLMEILTNGDGKSIGIGAQRTTRDVRRYFWNGLEVTDVPGVAAFEGKDDEKTAFEAAKQADLVLFLITDDAPQAVEAEFFARVCLLGKSVIGICNVKVSIDDEDDLMIFLDSSDEYFQRDRVEPIVRQFYEFVDQHIPGHRVPFFFTHLRSRFLANKSRYAEHRSRLVAASQFSKVESAIVQKVRGPGTFLRVKNFLDAAATPLLDVVEKLLDFSAINSRNGRVIIEKRRQFQNWVQGFMADSFRAIDSLASREMDQLRNEVPSFVEYHYEDRQAGKHWERVVKGKAIEVKAEKLRQEIIENLRQAGSEVARELKSELSLVQVLATDHHIGGMEPIFDSKRACNWATIIISGLALFGGPAGWMIAAAVGVIGTIFSWFFEDKEEKARRARHELAQRIFNSINEMERSLKTTLRSWFEQELLNKSIHSLFRELDTITSMLVTLADSQRELAWTLNNRQKALALNLVTEALRQLGAENVKNAINDVARIPGVATMLLIQPGSKIPKEVKEKLQNLLEENIWFVVDTRDPASLLSQAIGRDCDENGIGIEEKIRVAHVAVRKLGQDTKYRIRLAQQLTGLHIMLK